MVVKVSFMEDNLFKSIATTLMGILMAIGAYWARHTDKRLEALEAKDQETGERLARVEAVVAGIDKKLDYITEKIDAL